MTDNSPSRRRGARLSRAQEPQIRAAAPGRVTHMKLTPLGDRVVVKAFERDELTKGGIILPDTVREAPQEGEIQAVGPGRVLESGRRATMDLHPGDRIVFAKYGATEFKLDGADLLILREADILAVLA
jgi:chaperonin GroES